MAELKTKVTTQSVQDYLMGIADETVRESCLTICKIMEDVTQSPAKMWGKAIVGVGDHLYVYESGRTLDWFMMGFSPRKANISLYILGCEGNEKEDTLSRLGKHTRAKGCVYIKNLNGVNVAVLKEMCGISYRSLK